MPTKDTSILVNVAQRLDFKNKGSFNNFKNSTRVCTFGHKSGHTIDFCYQNHGHPNFNKLKSSLNASYLELNASPQQTDDTQVVAPASNNVSISQAQYEKPVTLLKQ